MTNHEFASAYFEQAISIYGELKSHYKAKEWHLVVRRAQESVELLLKGFLRQAGIEIPRIHDVGNILKQEQKRLPLELVKALPKIISISRRLRQERETSFYGDEEQELPPSALYSQVDADQAKQDVEWLLEFMPSKDK